MFVVSKHALQLAFHFTMPCIAMSYNCTSTTSIKKYRNHYRRSRNRQEDSLILQPVIKVKAGWLADTSITSTIHISTLNSNNRYQVKFVNTGFNLDVMTILFKYRPYAVGFPKQFISTLMQPNLLDTNQIYIFFPMLKIL